MLFQNQILFILLLNYDVADAVSDLDNQIFTFDPNSDADTDTDTDIDASTF